MPPLLPSVFCSGENLGNSPRDFEARLPPLIKLRVPFSDPPAFPGRGLQTRNRRTRMVDGQSRLHSMPKDATKVGSRRPKFLVRILLPRLGNPPLLPRGKAEAVLTVLTPKVERGFPCWRWKAAISDTGYGSIGVEGKTCYAHRLAYERYNGPIPPGFDIDHLCRNRWCVNPDHLEAVPRTVNLRRGLQGALKKTCAQGHPWTEEHIYHRPGSAKKMCGTCNRERSRARSRSSTRN